MLLCTDYVCVHTHAMGPHTIPISQIGLRWPPPERIVFDPWLPEVIRAAKPRDPEWEVLHLYEMVTMESEGGMVRIATYHHRYEA